MYGEGLYNIDLCCEESAVKECCVLWRVYGEGLYDEHVCCEEYTMKDCTMKICVVNSVLWRAVWWTFVLWRMCFDDEYYVIVLVLWWMYCIDEYNIKCTVKNVREFILYSIVENQPSQSPILICKSNHSPDVPFDSIRFSDTICSSNTPTDSPSTGTVCIPNHKFFRNSHNIHLQS